MKTHIPYLRQGPEYDALARCIDRAAAVSKVSDERMVIGLTAFFEQAVDLVAIGKVVPLFGLGKLGAVLEERSIRQARHNRGFPYCYPMFVASPTFRSQVKATAPTARAAKKALFSYRRNGSRRAVQNNMNRVFDDMKAIRESIAEQMRTDD